MQELYHNSSEMRVKLCIASIGILAAAFIRTMLLPIRLSFIVLATAAAPQVRPLERLLLLMLVMLWASLQAGRLMALLLLLLECFF